jgi:hypothetical protein
LAQRPDAISSNARTQLHRRRKQACVNATPDGFAADAEDRLNDWKSNESTVGEFVELTES